MFTRIRIENFKAWKTGSLPDAGMELGRVTLLLGTNSSGKTSLLQPFRLIQQTVTSPDPDLQLNLGGETTDLVNLGSWHEVIHRHDGKEQLRLGFDLQDPLGEFQVDVDYELKSDKHVAVMDLTYSRGETYFKAVRMARGGYYLIADDYETPSPTKHSDPASRRVHAPQRSLSFSTEALQAFGTEKARPLIEMQSAAYRAFDTISYLGPLRTAPTRTSIWNQQRPGVLGADGSGAIRALLSSANTAGDTLVHDVGTWLKRMGLADDLAVKRLGRSSHYEVRLRSGAVDSNLLDVGFGISQVLPVITLAHFAPENSTVIIEEPEIHLHPLAQSLLAELFVETSKTRNLQFLIETHSEHLFRRMQTLIASQQIEPDEVKMYFVERDDEGDAKLRILNVDPYGRVENWPDDFFGDAVGETERQMESMFERRRKEKLGG